MRHELAAVYQVTVDGLQEMGARMIQQNSPADPEIHRAACIVATRITIMLAGILRDEERGECQRESYMIVREVVEELMAYKSGRK